MPNKYDRQKQIDHWKSIIVEIDTNKDEMVDFDEFVQAMDLIFEEEEDAQSSGSEQFESCILEHMIESKFMSSMGLRPRPLE